MRMGQVDDRDDEGPAESPGGCELLVVGLMAASLVVVVGGFAVTGCDPVYGC
jgi:hypothetical protein